MAERGLNLFYECAADCVHLRPQEEECTSSFWRYSKLYTPGTIANPQRVPTKINKEGAIAKVRIFVEQMKL